MARALLRRLLHAAAVLVGISVLVFLVFFATPGDPAARIAGRGANPETLAAVRREYGLDQPLPVQYARTMQRLLTGGLSSWVNRGQPVLPALLRAAPLTGTLAAGAAALWVLGGALIGVAAALRGSGSAVDRLATLLGLLAASVPVVWLGQVVNGASQDWLHGTPLFAWVPPLGYGPELGSPGEWLRAMALPCATLALLYAGLYGRALRASLGEALRAQHVRTARAKGLSEPRVVLRHALRGALGGLVALLGLDLGALLGGGTLLIEVVFGLRGIGHLTYDALQTLDQPAVMAAVLFAAAMVVLVNTLADMLHAWLDPRVRGT